MIDAFLMKYVEYSFKYSLKLLTLSFGIRNTFNFSLRVSRVLFIHFFNGLNCINGSLLDFESSVNINFD